MIDYRGDDTIINSRGDCLFDYRTKYFLRIQEDFHYWKQWGHKFRCFTQHHQSEDFKHFDDVVYIPRGNAAASRNQVLDYYKRNSWIAILDNDCSLYFNRLDALDFIKNLDDVISFAEQSNIVSFVPFNPLVQPYPKILPSKWTFQPQVVQNAFIFCKVMDFRYDESLTTREDYDIGCQIIMAGYKCARLANISLRSMVNGKSTIFKVNAYHEQYKKPGPKANPKGLLKWDAQLDRIEKYNNANNEIEQKYQCSQKEIEERLRIMFKPQSKTFNTLFEYATN